MAEHAVDGDNLRQPRCAKEANPNSSDRGISSISAASEISRNSQVWSGYTMNASFTRSSDTVNPAPPSQHSSSRRLPPSHLVQSAISVHSLRTGDASPWALFGPETHSQNPNGAERFQALSVLLTTADHNVIHPNPAAQNHPYFFMDHPTSHSDEPDFAYLRELLAMLLLTTTLAWCSAIDARFQCSSQEAYDVYELFDDDALIYSQLQRIQEKQLCLEMFRFVMLPVGVVTGVLCVVALYLIRPSAVRAVHEAPSYLLRRLYCQRLCRRLLLTFPLVLCAWSYGIGAIMLQPRSDFFLMDDDQYSTNPYHSLAAVDYMGHVGDNANLYYTSWLSLVLSLAIVYQIVTDAVRQYRRYRHARAKESDYLGTPRSNYDTTQDDIEAMLSSSTSQTQRQWQEYHESRATWYNSFYRLRIRSSIWVAALFASLVVMASSIHLWRDVLLPTAQSMNKNVFSFRQVCPTLKQYRYETDESLQLPPQLCARTSFSIVSGCVGALLCLGAVVLHMQVRQEVADVVEGEQHTTRQHDRGVVMMMANYRAFAHLSNKMYLQSEFSLSVVLCCLLGLNAVFATGVQGPASTVGNLYYASWVAFLLCLRICLGCLEELYNIEKEEHEPEADGMEMKILRESTIDSSSGNGGLTKSYEVPSMERAVDASSDARSDSVMPPPTPTRQQSAIKQQSAINTTTDLFDNHRARRLRRLLLVATFSSVCAASAIDAAVNQETGLTRDQRYVMIAPAVVAFLCVIQFVLCLRTYTYALISNVWTGLLLSFISFALWLAALIIQTHSENSWSVNAVGDIQMANLYYFSWLSIITAGLHMSSYLSLLLGLKKKDYLTIAWLAIIKICFVILGAGIHIWWSIKATCTLADVQSGTVTFCSRTIFAIVISLTGMLVGGLVVFARILIFLCCPAFSMRIRAHVEMIISIFLVLLFGVAVALITGIGGPGQSVGDLYYATWLAFFVAIFVGISCVREILKQDNESEREAAAVRKNEEILQADYQQFTS